LLRRKSAQVEEIQNIDNISFLWRCRKQSRRRDSVSDGQNLINAESSAKCFNFTFLAQFDLHEVQIREDATKLSADDSRKFQGRDHRDEGAGDLNVDH